MLYLVMAQFKTNPDSWDRFHIEAPSMGVAFYKAAEFGEIKNAHVFPLHKAMASDLSIFGGIRK